MSSDCPVPPSRPRRVTAKTVAEAAGVSRSAVSRAFTDGSYLDAEKRKRIKQVAAELGYQPNALAAGLQAGQSGLVAIFVGNMRSTYDTEFTNHLVRALNTLNKWPILIDGSDEGAKTAMEALLRYPLDAMILRGGSMTEGIVAQCTRLGVPMISSGRPISAAHVDNVCCLNADGTAQATRVLLERGRRRIGFIGGPSGFYSSGERLRGVTETLDTTGLSLQACSHGDYTVDSGYSAARTMLAAHQIDGLICANDATAIGALTAARDMGIDVPKALSVIGFDDIGMAKWPTFNLTTVRNPIDAAVSHIVDLLERRLAQTDKPAEMRHTHPRVVLRGTH
ncbi:LacI family DNA-binding transcriptional regulator [Sagittula sp. SSi028]|uniref:LacI family DNA-binding transcriptional regulator n=1 Tax=Sagittula sp. SSi028 TaxID=3400636 RepID=UPI003AF473B4